MERYNPYYASMPRNVAIRCPRCRAEASFTPPNYTLYGAEARAARADPSLTGVGDDHIYTVVRYPAIFPWSHPANRQYDWGKGELWGICVCPTCGYHNKHLLDWPNDAYYAVEVRNNILWAWNREYAVAVRRYLATPECDPVYTPGINYFLIHIPKMFRMKRNRELARKKLEHLLCL